MAAVAERNQDATVYVGGLDDKVTEHLLAELFIQGKFPPDKLSGHFYDPFRIQILAFKLFVTKTLSLRPKYVTEILIYVWF